VATDIGALPDHMQLMVVGSVVVISSVWGVVKFLRPFIDNLSSKPSQHTTDAVVISAALADGRLMHDLTSAVNRLCEAEERGNETKMRGNIINEMLLEAINRLIHKP
jgi:hypothetical protein